MRKMISCLIKNNFLALWPPKVNFNQAKKGNLKENITETNLDDGIGNSGR